MKYGLTSVLISLFINLKGDTIVLINLQQDYKKIIVKKIKKSGLRVPTDFNDEKLIITYYSYLRKKSFAGPHKIVKSKDFYCPKEVEIGFEKLEDIIKNGGDITPYFNRTASNLSEYDDMFSDWGIIHFHLGDKLIEGEHLVERNNPVLFAYQDNGIVYFIQIYKHGYWSDSSVIQEMYDNWPELLEKFIFKGVNSLAYSVNKKQLRQLRECGITTPVEIVGQNDKKIVLMPPGMGVTAARTSISDTRLLQKTMNDLGLIQIDLISKEEIIKKDMQSQGIKIRQEISFELERFDQNYLYLVDNNHNYTITVRHA